VSSDDEELFRLAGQATDDLGIGSPEEVEDRLRQTLERIAIRSSTVRRLESMIRGRPLW
jgi:hypothetical protein